MESRVQQHFGQIGGCRVIAKDRSNIRTDEPKKVSHDAALSLPVLLEAGGVAGALLVVLSAAGVLVLAAPSAAGVLVLAADSPLPPLLPPLCAR